MVSFTNLQTCQSKKKKKNLIYSDTLWCTLMQSQESVLQSSGFQPYMTMNSWVCFFGRQQQGNNELDWEQRFSLHSLCYYPIPPHTWSSSSFEGRRRKGNNSLPHPWNLSIFHQLWDLHSLIPFPSAPIRLGPLFCLENISQSFPYNFHTLSKQKPSCLSPAIYNKDNSETRTWFERVPGPRDQLRPHFSKQVFWSFTEKKKKKTVKDWNTNRIPS